ncbi:general stress protein [Kitasatospora sp. NPDC052896]|uniref:general stress protein n=1 Tax=Kitasatospora sp. NPDC052896 TaxID=3364061 RepID=UPI0037C81960
MGEASAIVGVYKSMHHAEEAVRILLVQGVPAGELSIIGTDLQSQSQVHGFVTTKDVAKSGATAGAWTGGLFGVLSGAALLLVPGVGPLLVLGPLAAGAVGAAEGAVAGGGLGAVLGHFIAKRHVPKYVRHLEAGSYLVVRHGPQAADSVARFAEDTHASEVEHHPDLVTGAVAAS